MRLTPHPDTPCQALDRIEVSLHRATPSTLTLTYLVVGDMNRVSLSAYVGHGRADELWKTTCFEVFVRGENGAYVEFNFAPSGQWAGYAFNGYREAMRAIAGAPVTANGCRVETGSMGLIATIDLSTTPAVALDGPLTLGLSAVIEETSGAKSYWALAHAPGKPDFHHPDAFALDLTA